VTEDGRPKPNAAQPKSHACIHEEEHSQDVVEKHAVTKPDGAATRIAAGPQHASPRVSEAAPTNRLASSPNVPLGSWPNGIKKGKDGTTGKAAAVRDSAAAVTCRKALAVTSSAFRQPSPNGSGPGCTLLPAFN
jgi:hypothetical protein